MATFHLYSRVDRRTIEPLHAEDWDSLEDLLAFYGVAEPTSHTRNAVHDITWFDDIGIDSTDLRHQIETTAPREPTTCTQYRNGRGRLIDYQALARKIDQRERLSDQRRARLEGYAQAWRARWHDDDEARPAEALEPVRLTDQAPEHLDADVLEPTWAAALAHHDADNGCTPSAWPARSRNRVPDEMAA